MSRCYHPPYQQVSNVDDRFNQVGNHSTLPGYQCSIYMQLFSKIKVVCCADCRHRLPRFICSGTLWLTFFQTLKG